MLLVARGGGGAREWEGEVWEREKRMGGSFSREIRGSLSGRERAPKGFEEIRGESVEGPEVGRMGVPRGEEGGGTADEEALGGAEEGIGLVGADLGGASSGVAFNPGAVFFFFTVSH